MSPPDEKTKKAIKLLGEEGFRYGHLLKQLETAPPLPAKYCTFNARATEFYRRGSSHVSIEGVDSAALEMLHAGMHIAYVSSLEKGEIADCSECKCKLACLISADERHKWIRFQPK